ncbi:unnamed protein product [Chrysoparadoxa australica]
MESLNRALQNPCFDNGVYDHIIQAVSDFLAANLDAEVSPNLASGVADDLSGVVNAVSSLSYLVPQANSQNLVASLLRVLKVLLRKHENRKAAGKECAPPIINLLKQSATVNPSIACECANVLLNMCYDPRNIGHVLDAGGLEALVSMLHSGDVSTQACSLGALQSVCFAQKGRECVRRGGAATKVVAFMLSPDARVRTRALGCVHNLSSDASSIGEMRAAGALPPLIAMLRSPSPEVCGAAAGTIQNMSREPCCRQTLLSGGAVPPLADLLLGTDTRCQISAAGALFNILGPDVAAQDREIFKTVLSDGIVLGALGSCLCGSPVLPPSTTALSAPAPPRVPSHR